MKCLQKILMMNLTKELDSVCIMLHIVVIYFHFLTVDIVLSTVHGTPKDRTYD
jgi:hypothetical protein